VKKPGFTNPAKENVRLVMGKPQTINFALVPTLASLAVADVPETQAFVDGTRTGVVASTGVPDVSFETEKILQPREKLTTPVAGRVASDSPDSETVATASFEPIAPSRLNTILKRMSPSRVVHPREKVGFVPAKPIHEATPSVPLRLMRGARAQVSASVRVIIDKHGKVTSVNREPATEKGPLPDAAMAAAWNWTFKPARKGSNPVESQAILHFLFQNPEFASANR
jgi:outer membrane biosynthesis protein TonB